MKHPKPTIEDLIEKSVVVCDDESLLFVPVEKLTLMFAATAIIDRCKDCVSKCSKCVYSTTFRKIRDAINLHGLPAKCITDIYNETADTAATETTNTETPKD